MAYAEVHGLEDIKDNLLFFMYTSYIYVIHRNMSSKDHVFFSHIYIYVRIMIKDDNKV
jgi:phosphate starvation-inducible membrane PsiE